MTENEIEELGFAMLPYVPRGALVAFAHVVLAQARNVTDRELLQRCIDTLESMQGGCTDSDDGTVEAITVWCPELIDALRAALAQPESEPVAWRDLTDEDRNRAFDSMPDLLDGFLKTWGWLHFSKAIELECKRKNATPQAQPAPAVPDAPPFDFAEWHINLMMLADAYWEASTAARHRYREKLRIHALNAGQHWKARDMIESAPESAPAAPAVQPLTLDQIIDIRKHCASLGGYPWEDSIMFARAIERAHGITGDSNG